MELITPRSITVEELVEGRLAKMVFEPLERGYGTTLGNGLRRMLLSSLVGCAVVRVAIDGVMHEFDTLPGVREDVADIILSLKELDLRMEGDDPQEITLDVQGPAIVTAADIQCPAGVSVLNPDLVLAHLSEDGVLKLTATVEKGRGYLPVAEREGAEQEKPIGTLLLDASFSPVRRVAVRVENARVSQKTNYDKLILEVETNGAVTPRAAVAEAARIIQDQLAVFSDFGASDAPDERGAPASSAELHALLDQSIENLDLSARSINCLKGGEIFRIGDLVRRSEREMMHMPNFGKKSLVEIKEALDRMGLHLGMDVSAWDAEREEAADAGPTGEAEPTEQDAAA
ncbi:MAG: DNA-directed RNA polymerase subunit alpha [Zetaproteobacteria bacterium]|nr:MAG: DNA-directed RNA polymerase subunit alpha [Zetaproteobacteria bacterium]